MEFYNNQEDKANFYKEILRESIKSTELLNERKIKFFGDVETLKNKLEKSKQDIFLLET
jgi:hypothetical protein